MITQLTAVPAPSTALSPEEFGCLVVETAARAGRTDLTETLTTLGHAQLAFWTAEYEPTKKATLAGFVRLRLADLLIVQLLQSKDKDAAVDAAIHIEGDTLCKMAFRMAQEHRTPSAVDDLLNHGRLAIHGLMGTFDPALSGWHGYAFGVEEPKRVRRYMMAGLHKLLGLSAHEYRKACEVRKAQETSFKAAGHETTLQELADALGVKGLGKAEEYRAWKAIAFDGFGRPGDDMGGDDGEEFNAEDHGKFGEAAAEDIIGKRLRHREAHFYLRLIKIANPKQARVISHKFGFEETPEGSCAFRNDVTADAYRQSLCRGVKQLRQIALQSRADDSFRRLADMLHIPYAAVAQTYKECVGFWWLSACGWRFRPPRGRRASWHEQPGESARHGHAHQILTHRASVEQDRQPAGPAGSTTQPTKGTLQWTKASCQIARACSALRRRWRRRSPSSGSTPTTWISPDAGSSGAPFPRMFRHPGSTSSCFTAARGRFFHVGETDEATFGWVRELDDAFLMTGRVIGQADEKDPAAVAKVIMDAFHADPDAGDLLVPEESLFAPGARPEAMVR
jgi:hypothetical protein